MKIIIIKIITIFFNETTIISVTLTAAVASLVAVVVTAVELVTFLVC